MRASAAPFDPRRLDGSTARRLDQELPGWDYVDSFQVPAQGDRSTSAREASTALFSLAPTGRRLIWLRDALVAHAGLHPSSTARTGVLPIVRTGRRVCVLGVDDRHLDFRVLVEVDGGNVCCTTVVRRHHWGGRLYFAVVRPFHRRRAPTPDPQREARLADHFRRGRPP